MVALCQESPHDNGKEPDVTFFFRHWRENSLYVASAGPQHPDFGRFRGPAHGLVLESLWVSLSFFPRWWLFVRRLMNLMWNVFSVDRRGLFQLVWADFSASFSRISRVRVRVNEDFLPRPRLNGASVDGLVLQPADLLRECTSRRSHS